MAFLNYDGLKRYDKRTKEYIDDKINKASLSGKVDLTGYAKTADLNAHISDTDIHITSAERDKWNEVDEKLSIQQAVGDAGKILKVGNDGNIEFVDGGSDSTWKGTKEEWEVLSSEEKGKYEMVCITND